MEEATSRYCFQQHNLTIIPIDIQQQAKEKHNERKRHDEVVLTIPIPNAKIDERPHRRWWAPGNYMRKCVLCGEDFIGDKRAGHCADCAYKETISEKVIQK